MVSVRNGALVAVLVASAAAHAQPVDPYAKPSGNTSPSPGSSPTPGPTLPGAPSAGTDPILAEHIAQQLVDRAQELLDQRVWVDAKQLAVEALVESSHGPAADHARAIIRAVNAQLGITDDITPPPPPPPPTEPPPDTRPIEDPTHRFDQPEPPPVVGGRDPKLAAMVHGGLYGGVIGSMLGAVIDSDHPAGPAVIGGLIGAGALTFAAPRAVRAWGWDEAETRFVGSVTAWGGLFGGLLADAIEASGGPTGIDGQVSAGDVLVGASVGATLGLLVGPAYDKTHHLTRGDVALVDTFTGMGVAGGFAFGFLMQPAASAAYSVNAFLGGAAGMITGVVMAPKTNTTPRRMIRVAGLAAAGGGLPYLIIAASRKASAERVAGGLSVLGLVGGAWAGFYLTRHMDEGMDVPDGQPATAPASSAAPTSAPVPSQPLPPATPITNAIVPAMPILAGSF
jgi:hypothetical protein